MNKGHVATTTTGAVAGAAIGAKIGIAGFFGAVSGVLPVALLGAYVGHRIYKAATANDKGMLSEFAQGAQQGFQEKSAELKARQQRLPPAP